MREFKFRAWDEDSKRMITHEQDFIPLKICSLGVLRLDPTSEQSRWELFKGSRFKLMQWTGLKDKNGKEIYEGDIVKYFNEIENGIGYITFTYQLQVKWISQNTELPTMYSDMVVLCCKDEVEIIGNIYENPELMEGTNDR